MYSTSLHLLFSSDYVILLLLFTDTAKLVLKKASVGMYYTYVLITPTTLVCLLFSTAIPTSLFIKQLFFILVSVYFFMILDHFVILISFKDHN